LIDDLRGELTTKSILGHEQVSIELIGCLDMETTPSFAEFMARLTPHVVAGALREVRFDTAGLYLMSSSGISCFATFLKRVKQLEPPCQVTFRTSPEHAWQRRAFEPLQRLAGIVSVE
jgi:hypothetical protein